MIPFTTRRRGCVDQRSTADAMRTLEACTPSRWQRRRHWSIWTRAHLRRPGFWRSGGCRPWWSRRRTARRIRSCRPLRWCRFLVPGYVQDDPSLARVMNESMADRAGDKLADKRVRDLLPHEPRELAGCQLRRHDHRGGRDHGPVALPVGRGDERRQVDRRDHRVPAAGACAAAALTQSRADLRRAA